MPPREQAPIGGRAVLVRGGKAVLGGKAVVNHDDPRLELLGQHGPVEVVVVERARHEPAAVAMEHDALSWGLAAVLVPGAAHPAELPVGHGHMGGHRVPVERRQHRPHGAVIGVGVGEVVRNEGQDLRQQATGHGGRQRTS